MVLSGDAAFGRGNTLSLLFSKMFIINVYYLVKFVVCLGIAA
jgi:hypothetical protein